MSSPAVEVAARAVLLQLRKMTPNCAPALDLAQIIRAPAAGIITAIPLKPAPRIFVADPTLRAPDRERLRRIHPETVQRRIMPFSTKLCFGKPTGRKLLRAIRHVLSAEDSQFQHLSGRELRLEIRAKIATRRLCPQIHVTLLHQVVHFHAHRSHWDGQRRVKGRAQTALISIFGAALPTPRARRPQFQLPASCGSC